MTIKSGSVYWTTYSKEGEVIPPWPIRVTQQSIGDTEVFNLEPVKVDNPTELLHSQRSDQFRARIQLSFLDGVALFETKEQAFKAYPSLKLTELTRDMESVRDRVKLLLQWVVENKVIDHLEKQ
jgi:hypothetical protein